MQDQAGQTLCILNFVTLYKSNEAASQAFDKPTPSPNTSLRVALTLTPDKGAQAVGDESRGLQLALSVQRSLLGCDHVPNPGQAYNLRFRKGRLIASVELEGRDAGRDLAFQLAQRELSRSSSS